MTSLTKNARVAGLLYSLSSLFGIVRLIYIPNILIVHENASATANNIAAHEWLFRFGIVSYLLCSVLWIFIMLALYRLLKGVDQALALLMVILGLMATPVMFVNTVNDAAALLFARGADFLSVFDKAQLEAFVILFLNLHQQLDLANDLWGVWLIPFGLLVYRSRFLPRILGAWLMFACFAYLVVSFTGLLYPAYEDKVWNFAQPVLLAEVAIMLWLLIVGAKDKRSAATSP
jgi:hypothetical protein